MKALFFLAFATIAAAQSPGDLILQFKGTNGASLQYVTPSTGTGIPAFNGASPNRLELLPRSTFSTPADVAAYAQPLNSNLTTLAGVTSGTAGRNVLAAGTTSAAQSAIGLGITGELSVYSIGMTQQNIGEQIAGHLLFQDKTGLIQVRVGYNTPPTTSFDVGLPTAAGEWLTSGSSLNADNISSGSLALARIAQGGATSGQAMVWNGSAWAPGSVTAPVTSVAGRTGAITLSNSDISGLGTMATQAANNVTITGGSITGLSAFGLGTISSAFIQGDANTFYTFSGSCVGFRSSVDTTARLWVQLGIGLGSAVNSPDLFLQRDAANNLQLGTDGTTPSTQILSAADGTGTNATGADLVSQPGNGTGSGKSGKWAVETAPPGTSGSTATTMARRMEIDEQGVVKINNATTVPASNPTGGGYLYIEGGALKYRGSSGTVTTIANP